MLANLSHISADHLRIERISKPPGSGRGYETLVPIQAKRDSLPRPLRNQTVLKCDLDLSGTGEARLCARK